MAVLKEELTRARVALDLVVRYAETDAMGIVHHSTYIVWFEAARVAWLDVVGMPYVEIAAGGKHLAVTKVHAEYRAATRFGDPVRVIGWVSTLRSRQVRFEYEVRNASDDSLLASGATEHICVDDDGHVAKIPPAIFERLQAGVSRLAGENQA